MNIYIYFLKVAHIIKKKKKRILLLETEMYNPNNLKHIWKKIKTPNNLKHI
jgi:hypothetical protein